MTGGSSGIGCVFVRRMTGLGARVSVIALPDDDLASIRDELRQQSARFATEGADVTDRDVLHSAVNRLTGELGPCAVLFTCAGIAHPGYFERLDDTIFRRTMEVDYFGTLHAMRGRRP